MNFATYVDTAARNAPGATAVCDERESVTFEELARQSDQIAAALTHRGIDVGDHVALSMPNSVAFVCTYLGVLKRGAVAVPLNRRFTEEQTNYVLTDSDATAVVTSPLDDIATVGDDRTYDYATLLEEGLSATEMGSSSYTEPRRAEQLAELLYTSGTTGAPKGVYHTHGNLDANAHGYINCNRWSRDDVALTVCQCFHVTGLNITTTPFLVLEAENHVLTEWDVETALATIERHDVTYTLLIPTMVVELLGYDGLAEYDLSSLSTVGVGGSPMPEKRIDKVEAALECTLVEGYGMTETTPLATMNSPDNDGRKPGSVGRPVADVVAIRIENLRTRDPVERGERGEILWRGDTVTPQYNREQLTEDAFVDRDGTRWLTSGDIGWMDDDGFVHIVDRLEDMFTTGCGDVYPHEIEEVIYGINTIQQVAIIDSTDDLRGTTITAIVKCRDESVSADEIKRVCESRLESHEVPDRVTFVDSFPRTATGKLDRGSLRNEFG